LNIQHTRIEITIERKIALCPNCKNKTCLETGTPCKMIEAWLRAQGIYSRDYIRPEITRSKRNLSEKRSKWREIPLSYFGNYQDLEFKNITK
jgi:hypothetical protein